MKKLLVIILLAGALACGYQIGRNPDASNLSAVAGQICSKIAAAAAELPKLAGMARQLEQSSTAPAEGQRPKVSQSEGTALAQASQEPSRRSDGKLPVLINGRTYLLGAE